MSLRPMEPRDRDRILEIVTATGNFTPAEIEIAMEVVDEGLADPESGYYLFVAEDETGVIGVTGWECHGPTR